MMVMAMKIDENIKYSTKWSFERRMLGKMNTWVDTRKGSLEMYAFKNYFRSAVENKGTDRMIII